MSSKQAQQVHDACEHFLNKQFMMPFPNNTAEVGAELTPQVGADGRVIPGLVNGGTGHSADDMGWGHALAEFGEFQTSEVLKCMIGELELLTVATYHLMDGDRVVKDIHAGLRARKKVEESADDPIVDRTDGAWTERNSCILTEETQEDLDESCGKRVLHVRKRIQRMIQLREAQAAEAEKKMAEAEQKG